MYTAEQGAHSDPDGKVKRERPFASVGCSRGSQTFLEDISIHPPSAFVDHSSVSSATAGCSLSLTLCTCAADSWLHGGRPPGSPLFVQPCHCEANQRKPSCNLWILKRDAKGQGEVCGQLGSGGREVMDGTAAVLWFQVEIVQGRWEKGTAWTTRQLGLLGFHEAGAWSQLFCWFVQSHGRDRLQVPAWVGHTQYAREFLHETFKSRPLSLPKPKQKTQWERRWH